MTRPIDADALKGAFLEELFVKSGKSVQDIIDEAPTIEPSGDLISREDAIDGINKTNSTLDEVPICKDIRSAFANAIKTLPSADAEQGYTKWLEKIIVEAETFEWLCEDTTDKEWCEKNCNYATIQAECLRHLYEVSKGEPEPEPATVVAYICDRRRCAICRGEDGGCDHTTDIKHAAHFKNVAGQYFERLYMEEEDDGNL